MHEETAGFERDLRRAVRGGVAGDELTRGIYATDASIYQIRPLAVVTPRDADDVRAAVEVAVRHGVPILPRGGGTSLAGQTVGRALVLDFSKHMNRILELDIAARRVRLEPGLVRDELNAVLAPHRLHFAPDPATASRANVGGMIGNNSSGTRSLVYGKTIDHVLGLEVLLTDGTVLELGPTPVAELAAMPGREGDILRGLRAIVDENREEIEKRTPKVMRRVGGYPLDELLGDDPWNPAKVLVGSEGTLAVVLEATLALAPLPGHTALCVAHFEAVADAMAAVRTMLAHRPSAVEILDRTVLELSRVNLAAARQLSFLEGDPEAVLIVELSGDSAAEVAERAGAMAGELARRGMGFAHPIFLDAASQAEVWNVRKSGLGLMLGMKGDRKPLAFIEDAAVPVEVLPEYVERVLALCREVDTEVALYAHASVGLIHLRPILDLKRGDDIERLKTIAERTFELVRHYGGSWSGEHGDGLVRSPFNERFFGRRVYAAFQRVKQLFDPQGLMNPGKIVDAPPMDENLRYGTSYRVPELATEFRYREDGGFAAAVEMCTGVGQCRKTMGGTMCPSYIATRDEEHSTRGRANALRLAMSGQLGDGLGGERLHRALDLCLSCKACKSECPSNVDMAKLKGEVSQSYYDRHGTPLRDRLIGGAPELARRLAGPLAPAVSALQGSGVGRWALDSLVGLHRRRRLPPYAREPLPVWWQKRRPRPAGGRRVALFVDTYLGYHEPEVGRAAVELLESCGYEVMLAEVGCCQRPRLSHGLLRPARRRGAATLRRLAEIVERGIPVVVCEPSCASALLDDLPDLIEDAALGETVRGGVMMIDVFLERELAAGRLACGFTSPAESVLIHGHCHQKSLYGTAAMRRLLAAVPGLDVAEVDSGCCGMAGAFGYEREHYELSEKIGEDRLLPAVRTLSDTTTLVACGFSCRHQIAHFTGRRAVHWVEVLRGAG